MFFFSWPDRASLLVGLSDRAAAIVCATASAEGEAPTTVVDVASVFLAELCFDRKGQLRIEPLDGCEDFLVDLEEKSEAASEAAGGGELDEDDDEERCDAEAEDGTVSPVRVLRCELAPDHAGDHSADGGAMLWGDDEG